MDAQTRMAIEVLALAVQVLARRVDSLEQGRATGGAVYPARPDALDDAERQALKAALIAAGGVQADAAAALGISPRRMHYKVEKFRLRDYCRK